MKTLGFHFWGVQRGLPPRIGNLKSVTIPIMAKTNSINVPDELKTLYNAAIERSDPFTFGTAQAHKALTPDARKLVLKNQSVFRFLSPIWKALSVEQKNVWKAAAAYNNISGWQLFVSDNAARIRNDLPLDIPPSELWQVNAGRLFIESPATELILKQEHPRSYWVAQKIVGASWKKGLTLITEQFALPLELQLRYKSDLTPVGDTQSARYFARIWTSYQGQDIYSDLEIPINPSTDWTLSTNIESAIRGILIGYTLYLEIIGYTGEVLFDNIRAVHSGSNWALDPRCDDISKTFKKAFAIVQPYWVPVSLPAGSSFASYYPPAL